MLLLTAISIARIDKYLYQCQSVDHWSITSKTAILSLLMCVRSFGTCVFWIITIITFMPRATQKQSLRVKFAKIRNFWMSTKHMQTTHQWSCYIRFHGFTLNLIWAVSVPICMPNSITIYRVFNSKPGLYRVFGEERIALHINSLLPSM